MWLKRQESQYSLRYGYPPCPLALQVRCRCSMSWQQKRLILIDFRKPNCLTLTSLTYFTGHGKDQVSDVGELKDCLFPHFTSSSSSSIPNLTRKQCTQLLVNRILNKDTSQLSSQQCFVWAGTSPILLSTLLTCCLDRYLAGGRENDRIKYHGMLLHLQLSELAEGNSSCSLALVRKSGNHIAISFSLLGGLVHTDSAYLRWIEGGMPAVSVVPLLVVVSAAFYSIWYSQANVNYCSNLQQNPRQAKEGQLLTLQKQKSTLCLLDCQHQDERLPQSNPRRRNPCLVLNAPFFLRVVGWPNTLNRPCQAFSQAPQLSLQPRPAKKKKALP